MNNKPLHLLIDGNFLMFQSFYATYYGNPNNIMRNSKGVPTNGINLFLHQLIKLLEWYHPDYLYIAFDSKEKSFRHELYQDYKAGRAKAPNDLFIQFDLIKQILSKLGIVHQEVPGFEADDLIAAYCKNVAPNEEKIIFSRDKDLHQLINENISIVQKDSDGDYSLLSLNNYFTYYGFMPRQVVDYKALAGDNSDNLPGVKGIGDKTAIKILCKYGDVKKLYECEEMWSENLNKSVIEKLKAGKNEAMFCLQMAKLNPDVIDFDSDKERYVIALDLENSLDILEELELRSVINKLKLIW
ncbi:5'-3' exonuclease [Mycoplasmopsis verecunda]|uniref:5'-3' exonuclease n=1 Tax=Mycoplasmopsis verecunda TaxID=171291 RepID=A0A1T4KDF2_9BACT|nr:5'-3' exonuclease [Mycoplasmopsis verecunda]WPB54862.1 5'-3' exonuclease [Mycoplasmopsis verecunda]SJZ40430.1 DNA polymerase-1 [Mycoplasmopsis verecunda]